MNSGSEQGHVIHCLCHVIHVCGTCLYTYREGRCCIPDHQLGGLHNTFQQLVDTHNLHLSARFSLAIQGVL